MLKGLQVLQGRGCSTILAAMGFVVLMAEGMALATGFGGPHIVSQKGRAFQPGQMTIERGETLDIVNDDADLLHHAYIDADDFSFDSGDQEPGSRARIVFSKTGTFTVLCGIHPKMNLVVTVRDRS
jgi:plastocyanin